MSPTPAPEVSDGHASVSTDLRQQVAAALQLPVDEIGADDDLFTLGLESVGLIRLAGRWRRHGMEADFATLAEHPTLRRWQELLQPDDPGPATAATSPVPAATEEPFGLTTLQHAYWVGRSPEQPFGGVAAHFYVELDGNGIDPDALRTALDRLVTRHDALRLVFSDDGRQRITDGRRAAELHVHDLRGLQAAARADALADLREAGTHRRMAVGAGEVLRTDLSLLPGGATRLHLDLDMLAADALSMRVLLRDLCRLLTHPEQDLPPLRRDLRTELLRRIADAGAARDSADADWWRARLADLPPAPGLPVRAEAGLPGTAPSSMRLHHQITGAALERLTARAREHGIPVASVLAAAFAETLAAWSQGPELLLNLPVFDRGTEDGMEDLVGDFSSSVLLAADMGRDRPFAAGAAELGRALREAIAHRGYGGVEVLRDLARAGGGAPVLAPVVYTSAIGLGELYDAEVRGVLGEPVWIISQGPQVWLDAQVTELDGGLLCNWDVRTDVLDAELARSAFTAYRDLLDALCAADGAAWSAPALPAPAGAEVLAERRALEVPPVADAATALHAGFFVQAGRRPDAPALVTGDGTTHRYGELARRALQVAALLREHGIGPGATVAITATKGVEQLAAVLGVLAVGAAYAPVGAEQPAARRRRIYDRARIDLVLADAHGAAAARAADPDTPVLPIFEAGSRTPLDGPLPVSPEAPAYVLSTSGSTGEPKAVEIPHRAAMGTIASLIERFGIGPEDRTLAISALDFDLSVFDLFAPLSVGGAVVLPDEADRRDAERWLALVDNHGVTVLNTVPAVLDLLVGAAHARSTPLEALRVALLGGDVIAPTLVDRLAAVAPQARFVALGGMTEAAIHSTVLEVPGPAAVDPAWKMVPWGVPLPGVRVRVVDERGRDRPDGVAGELWMGGACLALGYRGDLARTAERFPIHDGERWYRTGDRAAFGRGSDGRPCLEFLGRTDGQVQLRGHRVELGEVEAALSAHPGVATAVVTPTDGLLLAAIVPGADGPGDTDHLALADGALRTARERLPAHMVPTHALVLTELPLTRNGKVDRPGVARLAQQARTAATGADPAARGPRGTAEQLVAEVWGRLLARPVDRDTAFFAAGGDSLLATRTITELRSAGAADASLAALFAEPVLAAFAATLTLGAAPARAAGIVPRPEDRHLPFPLTEVQRAYWVGRDPRLRLGGVGTFQYTEFDGVGVDLDWLARCWDELVQRHEMLRAVVGPDGTQRILPTVPPVRIDAQDATDLDEAATAAALDRFREDRSHQIRDLAAWPLFDVAAVRYRGPEGDERLRLGVGLDYLVLDALSIMILFTELDALYRGVPLPEAPAELSFRDHVEQVEPDPTRREQDERWWDGRIADLPDGPRLPLRPEAEGLTGARFARREHRFDAEWWAALEGRCRDAGLTPSGVLMAAYALVLERWSGERDLTLTLTLFDREAVHPEMDRLVGDFTGLTLLDHRGDAGAPFADLVGGLAGRLAEALDHRAASPAWILRRFANRHGGGGMGVPVVFTGALGVGPARSVDVSGAFGERVYGVSQSPQVLLDNQVLRADGGLQVNWDAAEAAFEAGVLDAMFGAYVALLDRVVAEPWDRPLAAEPPPEQGRRREQVNATTTERPGRTLHATVFSAARQAPERVALLGGVGDATWSTTAGELADGALRIAAALRGRGVGAGNLVGVALPKGPEQVLAVLGVLAAGAAYVPVSATGPRTRAARILGDAGVTLALSDGLLEGVPTLAPGEALTHAPLPEPVPVEPDALAYVIHTSGSTGRPKGVQITHDAAWSTVDALCRRIALTAEDRVLALAALDFDLSVFDLFGPLGVGGALVLPEDDERRDAPSWTALVREHGVTVWNSVPTLLEMLLLAAQDGPPTRLRVALVSGDWVPVDLAARLAAVADEAPRLLALGGATEAAIWSNAHDVDLIPLPDWPSVPYGRPLPDQRFRVVDPDGRDAPDLVAGELVIGGRGVALGYLGDPDRTAAAFGTDPDGVRWYRTGDRGRYRPDGLLEFLGRTDGQVKVGGYRIELGEIEAAYDADPRVARAVVVAVGDARSTTRRLHAAIEFVADVPADLQAQQLTDAVRQRLAPHAVPATVELVTTWPLTANGKLDRAALAAGARTPVDSAAAAPGTEREVAELWAEAVGLAPPGATVDLFAAGGDSLGMLRLLSAVERRFGVLIGVRTFLAAPTLRGLAAEIDRRPDDGDPTRPASGHTAEADASDADHFEGGSL